MLNVVGRFAVRFFARQKIKASKYLVTIDRRVEVFNYNRFILYFCSGIFSYIRAIEKKTQGVSKAAITVSQKTFER